MPRLKNNFSGNYPEAGCDEAGRGCLAGPVVAAAVILPKSFSHKYLDDSKKLTGSRRMELKEIIEEKALAWAVGFVDNKEIDQINILKASILAMHKALDKLQAKPEFVIVDGNKFSPWNDLPFSTIVKGDAKFKSIAAASILAKTYRDLFMEKIHMEFPYYSWDKNKGYPTKEHKRAIGENGVSPYHRLSFNMNEQLKIEF
ncbi:MAG: ribonuclease HII [Marinilabiliales bacterium]|nr:MAG: ribonuclease HII [Marinilabiliales bacterium]